MNQKRLEKLQETAKAKGKELFIESFQIDASIVKVETLDKTKFIEASDNTSYVARGIVRNVPISIYDINLNHRRYPKELFEKLERNNSFNRGTMLADHAENVGSVKDIAGIFHNFKVTDEGPFADIYCVGPYGELFMEVVRAGGKCGLSLSGFGQLLPDGVTVDFETYELAPDSCADWVFSPSAGVYATKEDNIDPFQSNPNLDTVLESTQLQKNNSNLKENTIENNNQSKTNNTSDSNAVNSAIIMENIKMSDVEIKAMQEAQSEQTRLLEKNMKHNAELSIKEALKSANKTEALDKLNGVIDLIQDRPSLQETVSKVKAAQYKIQESLEKDIADKEVALKEATQSVTDINTKYATLLEDHKKLEEKYKVAAKVATKMKESSEGSTKKSKILESRLTAMKKAQHAMLSDIAVFKEERKAFIASMKRLHEEMGEDWEGPEAGEAYLGETEDVTPVPKDDRYEDIDANLQEVEDVTPVPDKDHFEDIDTHLEEMDREEGVPEPDDEISFEEEEGEGEGEPDGDEMMEDDGMSFDDWADEEEEEHEGRGELEPGQEEVEPYNFDDKDGEDEMMEAEEDMEEPEEEDEEEKKIVESARRKYLAMKKKKVQEANARKQAVKKPAPVVSGQKKVRNDVLAFYKEAVSATPSIKDIKKAILTSKSLKEAIVKYNSFVNKKADRKTVKVQESTQKKIEHRTFTKGKIW